MTYERTASALVLVFSTLSGCTRVPVNQPQPALVSGSEPRPARPPRQCNPVGGVVDSVIAVAQARRILESSLVPLRPQSVEPVVAVVAKDSSSAFRLNEGFLVRLVAASKNVLGGGGLVWVDGETACPILLIRYQ